MFGLRTMHGLISPRLLSGELLALFQGIWEDVVRLSSSYGRLVLGT